jgi:hypothetical protein
MGALNLAATCAEIEALSQPTTDNGDAVETVVPEQWQSLDKLGNKIQEEYAAAQFIEVYRLQHQ